MVTSANIRAGGASVEIVADSRKLDSGLREAESKLRAYNQRVRQLNREATAAAKAGDQGQAVRLGMQARELDKHADRVRERASTLSQGDDARIAMAQRLASFKAGKAALLADQTDMEERLAAATMKPRELALRDLDRHFDQMRAKYAGNAKMLALIERTAAAERAKVNSDYSTGILGALGGKRLAKQEIKYAAANMAGVHGGEVGMAAAAALTMSAAAAGVVGGLILIGGAYQAAVKQAAALAEKQQAHAEAVRESVRWMQRMTVLWRDRPEEGSQDMEAKFLRLCEQYHNLEVWTDEEAPLSLPVVAASGAGFSYGDAEMLAKRVRNELNLGDRPALSLLTVLEEVCGVKVFHLPFVPSGTAASSKSETFGAAVLLNSKNVRWRRNFDLAHELFHLLTWNVFRTGLQTDATSHSASEDEEKLATCFARNLLMPADAVRVAAGAKIKADKITFDDLFDVSRQFDVSIEVLIWQMNFVGLLPGRQEEIKAVIERAKGFAPLLEEREQTEPPIWPERYEAMAIKALRHGVISIGRFAEYLGIGRQAAMRYVQREVTDDEEVPVAPA